MKNIKLTRSLLIPDQLKLELFRRSPELGPNILFFSGGTALRPLSQVLTQYTHNAAHLITTFDSGGSSAVLRKAFAMPAVGDIRSRIMALADNTVRGNPAIVDLFAHRLPREGQKQAALLETLSLISAGKHPLMLKVPEPMRRIIRTHLELFLQSMPPDFDLANANIGNLVLSAGYLSYARQLEPVIFIFSKLVRALGTVMPITNTPAHLAVRLADGQCVTGQHKFTGKEGGAIKSPVTDFWLCKGENKPEPSELHLSARLGELIRGAGLICYPMGSFYSSLLANILPTGVGRAVAENPNPKIYVPNLGNDPEEFGYSLRDKIEILLRALKRDNPESLEDKSLLNFILLDSKHARYPGGIPLDYLAERGMKVIDCPLVSKASTPLIDEKLAAEVLVSLC